ncbi:MAG TPA: hypothetical protein VGC76_08410 [Pyrinomonadaceae bacterium]|jgi:hypothetical protein
MKKFGIITIAVTFALFLIIAQGCSFSTANLSSLKTYKDQAGKEETSSYKVGDTIYGKALVSNNPGKVKVKLSLAGPKGETLKGSEVSVDIDGDGAASYSLPTGEGMPAGSYKLTADMINDSGEKKDSKSATITVAE